MARAMLASAAISALVLPLRVGDVIGTDGGWVRNFPLGHAYDNPDVREIVGFRYISRTTRGSGENLPRLRQRLEPFRAVPPVRALIGELRGAEERQERGEPPHLADMILRLMRVAVARNTELEVRSAAGEGRLRPRARRAPRGGARDRPAHGRALAPPCRRRRRRGAVRRRPLPVPPRPGAPGDDRAGRPRRARPRRELPRRARVAGRGEAGADRARVRADSAALEEHGR